MGEVELLLIAMAAMVLYYGFRKYGETHGKLCMFGAGAVVLAVLGMVANKATSKSSGRLDPSTRVLELVDGMRTRPRPSSAPAGVPVQNSERMETLGGISLRGGGMNLMENVYSD